MLDALMFDVWGGSFRGHCMLVIGASVTSQRGCPDERCTAAFRSKLVLTVITTFISTNTRSEV
jgi:hypothetical protein